MAEKILAVDPGKDKTGLCVLFEDGLVVEKKVAATSSILEEISDLCYKYQIKLVVIGNGGTGRQIEKKLMNHNLKVHYIFADEKGSTLEARRLYWEENKKKWFLFWVPASFLLPPKPYDDYAAVVIGRRYLNSTNK